MRAAIALDEVRSTSLRSESLVSGTSLPLKMPRMTSAVSLAEQDGISGTKAWYIFSAPSPRMITANTIIAHLWKLL